jgi:hypothetical protein
VQGIRIYGGSVCVCVVCLVVVRRCVRWVFVKVEEEGAWRRIVEPVCVNTHSVRTCVRVCDAVCVCLWIENREGEKEDESDVCVLVGDPREKMRVLCV